MNNEENVDVLNFHCVARFKRPDCRAAGVAIFKNTEIRQLSSLHRWMLYFVTKPPMILGGGFNNEVFNSAVWS